VEFPRAINEEPLQAAFTQPATRATQPALLLAQQLHRIMTEENAADPGGMRHACEKTFRSRGYNAAFQNKGWNLVNGKLHREFACKDFVSAFGNMTRVALVAEAMNHHPEWSNVWNKVVIDLNTHSVKGISDYDFVLAEKINEIFDHFRRWAFLAAEKASDLFGV